MQKLIAFHFQKTKILKHYTVICGETPYQTLFSNDKTPPKGSETKYLKIKAMFIPVSTTIDSNEAYVYKLVIEPT